MNLLNLIKSGMLLGTTHILSAMSCSKSHFNNCNVACTAVFASVNVQLTDAFDNPVTAGEVFTIRIKTGDTLRLQQYPNISGAYTILDDSFQKIIVNSTENFQFVAIKNGNKIVDESYTISADCCHIKKDSGKEKVII
ncbi:hypothetical protein BH09BAC2_BH09BAC2_11010 [soil metagenome]